MSTHGVHHATAESVRRAFTADLCTVQLYRDDGGISPVFHSAGAEERLSEVLERLKDRIGYDVTTPETIHHRRATDRPVPSGLIVDDTLLVPLVVAEELLGHLIVSGIATDEDELPRFAPLLEHTATTIVAMERNLLRLKERGDDCAIRCREAHHRMKNSLQTVTALLSMQAGRAGNREVSEQLQEAADRVRAIQNLYDHLALSDRSGNLPAQCYIESLLESLIAAWQPDPPVAVAIDAGDLDLDPKTLGTIGLVVNELATNALSYAYRETPAPHLSVAIRRSGHALEVVVADNGCGLPDTFDPLDAGTTGLGTQIVRHLAGDLDGTVTYRSNPGTAVTIAIPLG